MADLILIPDEELEETVILTCLGCGFEQEVPVEWATGRRNRICSRCWLEDRWEQDALEKKTAAEKPSQPPVAKKGQLNLFDKT